MTAAVARPSVFTSPVAGLFEAGARPEGEGTGDGNNGH
jgi:hypothetical protein